MHDLNERLPVKNYEGLYEVSRSAEIFNVRTGKQLQTGTSPNGYLYVGLYRNGIRKPHLVHRVFADVWLPNPDNLPQINHKNGIKTDNRLENLEWCTSSQNHKHAYDVLGRIHSMKGKVGTRKGKPKPEGAGSPPRPVRATHKQTGAVCEFKSISEAARQVGGSAGNICNTCQGKHKSTAGYRWEYI